MLIHTGGRKFAHYTMNIGSLVVVLDDKRRYEKSNKECIRNCPT